MAFCFLLIKNNRKEEINLKTPILRGDIFSAYLSPVIGREQAGTRPVLVIQNNKGNEYSPTIIVAALTSTDKHNKLPTHVALDDGFLKKKSTIMLEHIRTLDKNRLGDYIGSLNESTMNDVDQALAISIGLEIKVEELMILSLCPTCANHFYNSGYIIKKLNPKQEIKDTCTYCNSRQGYNFAVRKRVT